MGDYKPVGNQNDCGNQGSYLRVEVYIKQGRDSPCQTYASKNAAYSHGLKVQFEESVVDHSEEYEYKGPADDLCVDAFSWQSCRELLCVGKRK